jgi:beta-lactam-binding protein with PASTA domain
MTNRTSIPHTGPRPRIGLSGGTTWLPALVAGIFAFALATAAIMRAVEGIPSLAAQETGSLPQLVGMPLDAGVELSRSRGLTVQVLGERPDERYGPGIIVQQSPVARFSVDDESAVRVTLSNALIVPDVLGHSLPEAQEKLRSLGWKLARVEGGSVQSDSILRVSLQHPAPGVRVDSPGEMAVVLDQ